MAEPSEFDDKDQKDKERLGKGKDFMGMYSKVTQFTKELMDENTKLQTRINSLMTDREQILAEGCQGPEEAKLLRRLEELKNEKKDILNQYQQMEDENKDFICRYDEIETENNNLANLYVASYQLHSTLDLAEVLDIITEIIINLVGAQTFGVMMLNEKLEVLEPVKSEGMPLEALPQTRIGEGIIGNAAQGAEIYYREQLDKEAPIDPSHPMVCLPLEINNDVVGVIVVYKLLPQKQKLVKVDYDLFSLLAAHAAIAIFSSKLYGDSVRKSATIKGFLDLVTN